MTYQVMPPLSEADYAALKADIAERGIMVPIEVDEDGAVLDGHHRVRVCAELDIHCPRFVREGMDEAGKRTHALALNLCRRQLSREDREAAWLELRRAGKSLRNISEADGTASPATIMRRLAGVSDETPRQTIQGRDGKTYPARRPFVTANTGKIEWYTPLHLLECAREVLGDIDFDPASSATANDNVQAARYFSAEDDALSQEWPLGRIWMNPPYSQPLMKLFCDRFAAEMARGSTGIALVNNASETRWFNTLIECASAVCFLRGRVRFINEQGEPGGAPLQGQAVVYSGPNVSAFAERFGSSGFVLGPLP